MKVKSESEVTQLCLTLSDPMDCSPPGSSIHGILQARVLEWGAIAFSENIIWFVVIHTVKGFNIVNETEVDVFLKFPCFSYDPAYVGNLISGSSSFSKSSLDISKFLVHLMLNLGMQDFKHEPY